MILIQLPENSALADTIATVFRDPAYGSQSPSLGDMILRWINGALQSLLAKLAGNPAAGIVVRWGLIAIAVLILARISYVLFLHYRSTTLGFGATRHHRHQSDPWAEAHQLAASGRYTDAAHALYFALLTTLATRGKVTLHESKTAGDYFREIRGREARARNVRSHTSKAGVSTNQQPTLLQELRPLQQQTAQSVQQIGGQTNSHAILFRDFARDYETVVYGIGTCDASTFARLRDLAAPVIEARVG